MKTKTKNGIKQSIKQMLKKLAKNGGAIQITKTNMSSASASYISHIINAEIHKLELSEYYSRVYKINGEYTIHIAKITA